MSRGTSSGTCVGPTGNWRRPESPLRVVGRAVAVSPHDKLVRLIAGKGTEGGWRGNDRVRGVNPRICPRCPVFKLVACRIGHCVPSEGYAVRTGSSHSQVLWCRWQMERGASVRAVITAMAIRNGFVSLKGAQPNPDGKLAILLCDRNVCHVEARNRARRIVGDLPRNLLLIAYRQSQRYR